MQFYVIEKFFTLDSETTEICKSEKSLENTAVIKQSLEDSALAIAKFCSDRLTNDISNAELKEIKDLAKLSIDLYKTLFGQSDITINNIQNISNNQLNFFKSSLKDEI